jgi:heme exporter protein A
MLQVFDLGCRRGAQVLWRDINFHLAAGKLLQVTGANGCGKTSLLRILAGLAPADAGQICWQGLAIARQQQSYQQQLNYIGHQPAIKSELTVRENLWFNNGKTVKKSLYHTAIERVGLENFSDHFGYQLSQGQKQRLAIARLLLHPALLWIVDEPMAGLDAAMMETLQAIFAGHIQQGGLVVLTTHKPFTLAALAPATMVLNLTC